MNIHFNAYTEAVDSNTRLAILDNKCMITWVDDKFCRITQYEAYELVGKSIGKLNLVCISEKEFRSIHAVIASGEVWSGEIKSKAKDGSILLVKTTILPILNKDKSLRSYLIIGSNITSKAALEEKEETLENLTRSEARYRALVENQPDLISLCSVNGTRIYVNEKYCEFMGKERHELLGTNIMELTIGGLPPDVIQRVFDLSFENIYLSDVYELKNAQGTTVWISLSIRGIFDDKGNLYEILTIGRDVTPLKIAEIKMTKYVEDMERITFMTSHKVRAPIATMLGLLELLKMNAIPSDQWDTVLLHFRDCISNLDLYTRELSIFLNQRQSINEEDHRKHWNQLAAPATFTPVCRCSCCCTALAMKRDQMHPPFFR